MRRCIKINSPSKNIPNHRATRRSSVDPPCIAARSAAQPCACPVAAYPILWDCRARGRVVWGISAFTKVNRLLARVGCCMDTSAGEGKYGGKGSDC